MAFITSPLHIAGLLSALDVRQLAYSFTGNLMQNQTFRNIDYDVHPTAGFFPSQPLQKLPSSFSLWEAALEGAQDAVSLGDDESDAAVEKRQSGETWRSHVRSWPVLDTSSMQGNLRTLQRAHMVLAFILHYYAHSIPTSESCAPIVIPRSVSIPLVAVSKALGTAPVLTFADVVLWNHELVHPDAPLAADNIRYVHLLSGNETERAFYEASGAIELKGVEMLQIIESFMSLPNTTDTTAVNKIVYDLATLKGIVEDMTKTFAGMRETVDPKAFYWHCRPWWVGAPASGSQKSEWIYEGVPASAIHYTAGPSAGQSSVMHALDLFLDIDHKLAQRRQPAPSENNKKADTGFMERMRYYMPGLHRQYLERLASSPRNLRSVAQRNPALREAYNDVVAALKRLRDVHIRVVTLYVVTQSHSAPPADIYMKDRDGGKARGTGGMEASNLMKAGRDATARAMLRD